ncbi:unnamed protein product, partial [Heterosigma akashiwo]
HEKKKILFLARSRYIQMRCLKKTSNITRTLFSFQPQYSIFVLVHFHRLPPLADLPPLKTHEPHALPALLGDGVAGSFATTPHRLRPPWGQRPAAPSNIAQCKDPLVARDPRHGPWAERRPRHSHRTAPALQGGRIVPGSAATR